MILVKNHKHYNSEFPEEFTWGILDSYKLTALSLSIAAEIKACLKQKTMNYVPGLRLALNMISEMAEV
jgi:hypothetical protein